MGHKLVSKYHIDMILTGMDVAKININYALIGYTIDDADHLGRMLISTNRDSVRVSNKLKVHTYPNAKDYSYDYQIGYEIVGIMKAVEAYMNNSDECYYWEDNFAYKLCNAILKGLIPKLEYYDLEPAFVEGGVNE